MGVILWKQKIGRGDIKVQCHISNWNGITCTSYLHHIFNIRKGCGNKCHSSIITKHRNGQGSCGGSKLIDITHNIHTRPEYLSKVRKNAIGDTFLYLKLII